MQFVKRLGGGVDGNQVPTQVFVNTGEATLFDLQTKNGEELPCGIEGIKDIASIVKQLEIRFNAPVEIEFVVTRKKISIVQLRPITRFI